MNYTSFKDPHRIKYVEFLNNEIPELTMCRIIEKSIYNYAIKTATTKQLKKSWSNPLFNGLYQTKFKSIYANLKHGSYLNNHHFRDNVLSGEIDCSTIAELSTYDIFPDNWKKLLDKKAKQDKLRYELKPEAMTDTFKCRQCGSRSCSYYEVQTRSADEPMTQFINCLDCGNRWKQ